MQENSENKKSSKEMWLFLIFLDIAVLCVFAYFIYNSFGGEMQKQISKISRQAKKEASKTFVEEILVEEKASSPVKEANKQNSSVKEAPKQAAPAKDEAKEISKEKETKPAEVKTEPAKIETTNIAKAPAEEKKQSVFISGVGKTRKVTFKYYGEAKKVAIISGFTSRKPVNLVKKNGVWETTLVLYPGDYKYMYIVDNVETLDPNAPSENGRSVLKVR